MIFTGNFQSTHEITAVRQERIPPFFHIGIEIFRMFFRPVRKQYAFFFSFYSGHVLPYFFGCKGQDRSEDFDQCIENLIHGRLGAAADLGIGFFRVKTVFDDIQIDSTQIDGAEIVNSMIHDVELVIFISIGYRFQYLFHAQECPFIQFGHVFISDSIRCRIVIGQVAQEIAEGIADLTIYVGKLFQDFRREADITLIVS